MGETIITRRVLLSRAAIGAAAVGIFGKSAFAQQAAVAATTAKAEPFVPAAEDLMREHGVLERIMLIYEAAAAVPAGDQKIWPGETIIQAAGLVKSFIHDYHEELEEKHIFPLFKAGPEAELVKVLLAQHVAARKLTADIIAKGKDSAARMVVCDGMAKFCRMYRPHAARETTELFPEIQSLMTHDAYVKMSDEFEDQEHKLFGEDGFEKAVAQVARMEKAMGINDLSQFTPS